MSHEYSSDSTLRGLRDWLAGETTGERNGVSFAHASLPHTFCWGEIKQVDQVREMTFLEALPEWLPFMCSWIRPESSVLQLAALELSRQ